ncbi:MAG TPA: hypothetical protein P5186_26000 [Candidatus Paceibacterota bacterium]|nr:hypothetical protein [Verrucomicrobiota bacterium]HRY51513.1 hypothetical protein [Candidatus Paceibacterota bacterium]HSA03750.1 hypothetical protein [Candidatus Paceibacterota bacterium]
MYRTLDGWPACAYSRDGGSSWTEPAYKTYTPDGRRVKHPRAANFAWNCANGKFLYWFHNHGDRFVRELGAAGKEGRSPYDDRNPAWLMAGREIETPQGLRIEWSQPEILLYDDDPFVRMSYPDLLEQDGEFCVTETQKTIGRVHEIPPVLIDGLFNQFDNRQVASNGIVLNLSQPVPQEASMPSLPEFHKRDFKSEDQRGLDLRSGFSLDLWIKLDSFAVETTLLDSRRESRKGVLVSATRAGTIRLTLNDGRQEASWESDRGALQAGALQHTVITVDGGPKIITFVVNGVLCDGGEERQFGWGRFSPTLRAPNGADNLRISRSIQSLRLYNRPLRTSEAVGNFRAGFHP